MQSIREGKVVCKAASRNISQSLIRATFTLTFGASAVLLAYGLFLPTPSLASEVQATSQVETDVNLTAGPLGARLNQLARQHDVVLSFDTSLTDGKSAPSIRGKYSLRVAFTLLLDGTGLEVIQTADKRYTLRRKATSDSAAILPAVDVNGVRGRGEAQLPAVNVISSNAGFAPERAEVGPYRGQSMMEIPATVNVVSREVMDQQGALNMHDALRNVAGVVRQQQSGVAYDQLSIRGVNLDNRSSYMYNGMLPFDNNVPIPMENKERMEVLKGAAALYYGFVDPGGVVNMVTKRAGKTPITNLTLSTDNNGSSLAHVDIGRQFGENNQFGVRINALGNNVHTPIDHVNGYRNMFSAAFDWRVNNALTLKYDYEQVRASITETAGIVPQAAVGGVITLPRIPDPSRLLPMANHDTKSDAVTHLLRADYVFNDTWSGSISLGQSRTRRDRWLWIFDNYNATTGAGTVYGADQPGQDYLNQNVRAELNGVFKTGSIGHDVLIGASQNRLYQPSFNTYMYRAAQNLYDPVYITSLIRSPTGSKNTLRDRSFNEQTVRNGGVFLLDRISLTDQWQVVGSVRYSKYTTDQLNTSPYETTATTPSVSVLYKASPRLTLYGSYIEGLESAGTAPATAVNAGQSLPAAISRQREFGVRSKVSEDVLLSASYFELSQSSASTNSSNVYAINGEQNFKGLEASLAGSITKNLSVLASMMVLDAEVSSSTNQNLIGKTPENTPKRTASFFASYKLPTMEGLSINAGAYYMGERPINALNQAYIAGYTTYTAGLRYATTVLGKNTTFRLNVDNLTDKRYWSAAGSGQLAVGLPRTVTLSSIIEF